MDDPTADPRPDVPREGDPDAMPRPDAVRRRTRRQIAVILTIGACVIVLLWLSIVGLIETERDAAVDHARAEANNLSAAFQQEVAGKLDAIGHAMDVVTAGMRANRGFDIYAWAHDNPLLAATATANAVQSAVILSPDGKLLSTTVAPHRGPVDLSDRRYFRVQLEPNPPRTYISQTIRGRLSGLPGIHVSRRVTAQDGRLLGVIAFSLAPSHLTTLHTEVDLGPHGYLTLIGSDQIIRARFGADSPDGTLGAGERVPALPARTGAATSALSFVRTSAVDHVSRLYSVRDVAGYPLHVGVGFDLAQVLQTAGAHARRIEAIGLLATLMLGGLAALLIGEIRRRADRELALGDEQARLAAEIRQGSQVQARLRASEARLHAFAKMAADWFWEQDAELRFVSIGIESPLVVGGRGARIGKHRWEPFDTSETPEHWAAHRQDLLDRKPFRDFRYSRVGLDGKRYHFSVNGDPVYDEANRFVGYRGTGRDVSKEVAAEAELRAAKDRAEQAETLLRDAVDSISQGFVIFDRDDRFVMCNEAYQRLYPGNAALRVPGARFEDLVRSTLAQGGYIDARGREAEWLAERLRRHRKAAGTFEQNMGDGAWSLVTERRMQNGGIAMLRVDISALKQAQAALRASEARLGRAQEIAGIGDWELDLATGRYIWSKQMYRMRGISPEDIEPDIDNVARYVHRDDYAGVRRWIADLAAGLDQDARETRIVRPDGEVRVLRVEGRPERGPDGAVSHLAGTMQDITERRHIEAQLVHAQKMEAIGTLTGGMAHDFNNGLGVIIGNLDLLGVLIKADRDAAELCDEARDGALRCAELIRRLLAFARRQPLQPQRIDVNTLVKDTARLLGRTLGEHVALRPTLDATLWPAMADPVQLEAALVNLATNARDAMPNGGQLDIVTRNTHLDARYATLHPEVTPGAYVLIEVSDTGAGIAPDILDRIFEPFFTTKGAGRGTGLGLSMVFGFVKQSGGHLAVYSEPGRGSTFRLYLPRAQGADDQVADGQEGDGTNGAAQRPVVGGDETVLVVEDNAHLRRATAQQLSGLGYRVFETEDAEAALRVLAAETAIDLLFTDVVMPGAANGIDLAHQAVGLRAGVRVLLTSGFAAVGAQDRRAGTAGFRLLGKPYGHAELARAVREALDGPDQRLPGHGAAHGAGYGT